jgi:hypothetical protein
LSIASRLDPTKTTTTRRKFVAALTARFRLIARRIRELIARDDVFGLRKMATTVASTGTLLTHNRRWWAHLDLAGKVSAFRRWLRDLITKILMPSGTIAGTGHFWTDRFIAAAYRRGVLNAYAEAKPDPSAGMDTDRAAVRAAAIRELTASADAIGRIRRLQERAADGVEDIAGTLYTKLIRKLGDGLAAGPTAADLATSLTDVVRSTTNVQGIPLALDEVTYTHAEAQLDVYESMGHENVGIQAERTPPSATEPTQEKATIMTTGDTHVCPVCIGYEGRLFSIAEARGLIPIHGRCRCGWQVVLDDSDA